MITARRAFATAIVAIIVGAGSIAGCNAVLGIDEQGARPVPDEGGDADLVEAGEGGAGVIEKCSRDVDCTAPNGCYTPHCDTVLGACTYARCEAKDRTCAVGVCNETTFACSDPLPYTFASTSYDVSGVTSGCGANPRACAAAAFPFLFLGTRDDVVALRVDDFVGKAAVKVPIKDLTVRPQQMITSGRRLWVLGAIEGQAPPYKLAIATLDVPSDPTVAALVAHTTVVSYPFPSAQGFAAPSGGLYLVYQDATLSFPTAKLDALPADNAVLGLAPAVPAPMTDAGGFDGGAKLAPGAVGMYRAVNVPGGATIVAASGTRLVAYRPGLTFNLIAAPGTMAAATQPDLGLSVPTGPIGPALFAQGADGTVLMANAVAANVDCNCTSHARLQWVFPDAVATTTQVGQFLDPDTYSNPSQPGDAGCGICPADYVRTLVLPTWIDWRSALSASPFTGDRTLTDVRALGRDPFDGNDKRRIQTKATDTPKGDFATDRVALTSANGIGYLVLADGQGNGVSVTVIDPRCDAK